MNIPLPIQAIERVRRDPEFVRAMDAYYAELDRAIADREPVCTNRGACCRFASYGHNLFVTAVELAYFLAKTPDPLLAPPDRSFCPYQQAGQCTARAGRPVGCRVYFCDRDAQDWQPGQTESALQELAKIGDRFDIPYVYVEWTDALRQAGGSITDHQAAETPGAVRLGIAIDSHEEPS
ncbi:MAG: hypothetical protein H6817_00105 [Phycisphaerales bacterium]|nr:hypothetical protein [Phycisphaerales bacterium]